MDKTVDRSNNSKFGTVTNKTKLKDRFINTSNLYPYETVDYSHNQTGVIDGISRN